MELNDWQRLEKAIRWTGLSVNSFALNIGLNRGENLYQIKRGNNGISKDLAELISAKYPEISKGWILTGEGEMFVCESGERVNIPCYETDAVYLAGLDRLPQPAYMLSMPRFKGASFAALSLNKAMTPDIPQGATVILQEVGTGQIIPGHAYLIASDRITAMRTVKKEPEGTKLRLVAPNSEFDEIIIDICEVKKLFLVKGYIHYNQ